VEVKGVSLPSIESYLDVVGNVDLSFPITLDISKEQLLVLISMCTTHTIIGIDNDVLTENNLQAETIKCINNFIKNSWFVSNGSSFIVAPEIAVAIMCLATPDYIFAFNDENIDVSGEKLMMYVKISTTSKLVVTLHQNNDFIKIRVDSSVSRACKKLYSDFFRCNPFHDVEFLDKLEDAFRYLPEERYAVSGGISNFFIFKVFVSTGNKDKTVSTSSIYSLVNFNDLGGAAYKVDSLDSVAKRAEELYSDKQFEFFYGDCSTFFSDIIEVITNGKS
jgi:hypothetical protein